METLEEYIQKVKNYSDQELREILGVIDREKYADRFYALLREVEFRRNPAAFASEGLKEISTVLLCQEHKKEATRICEVCKKGLCTECSATRYENKIYCDTCARSIEPEEHEEFSRVVADPSAARAKIAEQLDNYKWCNFFIFIILFPAIAWSMFHQGQADFRWKTGQVFLFVLFFIVQALVQSYFYQNIRCPKCNSYLLFYFGDGWTELYRFRHCARCGYQIKK